jgi:hypothetical protein
MRRICLVLLLVVIIAVPAIAAKTVFTDGNKALSQRGTPVMAAHLNGFQNHRHDGIDQDGSAPINYAVATGTASAIVLTLTPALTVYTSGMPIYFKSAAANTGACTININGLGAKPIKNTSGLDPAANDIASGAIVEIVYNGTNFVMTSSNNATNHVSDVTGNVHGATQSNLANMIVKRDASGNFSAGTITATLSGNATTATTATNSTQLNGQTAAYYQPASTAITTGNIGSQSVSYATNSGQLNGQSAAYYQQASTAITTGNIGSQTVNNSDLLDGQHSSYFQPAATAINTGNIGSQSVNYATSSGSTSNTDTVDGYHASYFQPASTAITTGNISGQSVSSASYSGNGAKAWANFNWGSTGWCTLYASYNISGIYNNGNGTVTVYLGSALADGNYVVTTQHNNSVGDIYSRPHMIYGTPTSSSFMLSAGSGSNTINMIAVFR